MALAGKVEVDLEIKAPADKLYKIVRSQHHDVPQASSHVHGVEVHEGDWETAGSIKHWKYTLDGNVETFKEKVEVDEENKSISLVALEGHVLDRYKSYKSTFQVIPKAVGGLVKITIEYEKYKVEDPAPNNYLELCSNIIKDIDAHLLKE